MAQGSDDIRRVLEATDLVKLIGEQLPLKRKGREYVCVCPFHDDHAPSMYVSPIKQIYKCFACGAGGDSLAFVKGYFKMDFREALVYLAQRGGVTLTPYQPRKHVAEPGDAPAEHHDGTAHASKDEIAQANAAAAEFFKLIRNHPEHGKVARELMTQRGISQEMIDLFNLGAAPDRWDGLLTLIGKKGWDPRGFLAAGLLKTRETGGHYDAFRNRLMFPITDTAGRTVAFGGRKLHPEDEPKYLNSPESQLFSKSATLYALPQASAAIREKQFAVVVEGYTDAIACHQAGITNVVATLGTALTRQGARLLERHCPRVILMFDGDAAGQRAADRAVEVLFESTLDVRIATLAGSTDAKDPDELLKRPGGAGILQQVFDHAADALDYRFDRLKAQLDPLGLQQRAGVIEQELTRLGELGLARINPVRQAMIIRRVAALAGVDERVVRDAITRARPRDRQPQAPDEQSGTSSEYAELRPTDAREHALVIAACEPMLLGRLTAEHLAELSPAKFAREGFSLMAIAVDAALASGQPLSVRAVLSQIGNDELRAAVAGLAAQTDQQHEGDAERLYQSLQTKVHEAIAQALRRNAGSTTDPLGKLDALRRAHAAPGWKPTSFKPAR